MWRFLCWSKLFISGCLMSFYEVYVVVSLMSDSRVAFLIWFIIVAIVVAAVLILIEVRLKKRREREDAKKKEKTPMDIMKVALFGEKNVRKKLDIIGKTAKDFFKADYGFSEMLDYSELAKEFEKKGKKLEVKFCEEMFEAYYSDHKLDDKKIKELEGNLVEVCRRKNISNSVSRVPGFWDRVDGFLESKKEFFVKEVDKYTSIKRERMERDARIASRQEHELLSWIRKAIRMGYDKVNILNLLDDGSRPKREVKKALKIYEKEAKDTKKPSLGFYEKDGGIAQRIIKKEKDRLEELEAPGV